MGEVHSQLCRDSWIHGLKGCLNDINNTGKQFPHKQTQQEHIRESNLTIPNYSISISQSSVDIIRKLEPIWNIKLHITS